MMTLFSFIKIQGLILMGLISTVIVIPANAQSPISYAIGQYADPTKEGYDNNLKLSKVLSIPGANELEVSIIGQIEKRYDHLTLYDSHNKKIGKYNGNINEQFTVKGASIRVYFKSDKRTTDKGFRIKISLRLPAKVFKDLKEKLLVASYLFLNLGTSEAYAKISQNVHALKALQAKMQQTHKTDAFIEQVANELMLIAQTYKEVAAMNLWIMKAYQEQFDILKGLKKQTQYQIEQIEFKKQDCQDSLEKTQTQLESIDNHIEKQEMQVTMTGYKNILPSLNTQEKIWNEFAQLQELLEAKLRLHADNIGLFLHTLRINGKIYHEFAQAVLLRQNTISILSQNIEYHPFCDNLVKMLKSEKDIRLWIKKIEQSEFRAWRDNNIPTYFS